MKATVLYTCLFFIIVRGCSAETCKINPVVQCVGGLLCSVAEINRLTNAVTLRSFQYDAYLWRGGSVVSFCSSSFANSRFSNFGFTLSLAVSEVSTTSGCCGYLSGLLSHFGPSNHRLPIFLGSIPLLPWSLGLFSVGTWCHCMYTFSRMVLVLFRTN